MLLRYLLSFLVPLVWSLPFAANSGVPHEQRSRTISEKGTRLHPSSIIPLRVALRQSNLHLGYDKLLDISYPASKSYGKHLSAQEVHDLFAPSNKTLEAVKSWLIDAGLPESDLLHYENKGWLAADVPVHFAERLLSTKYYDYGTPESPLIGCDAYYLPANIVDHVDLIKPGVKSLGMKKKSSFSRRAGSGSHSLPNDTHQLARNLSISSMEDYMSQSPGCDAVMTPGCIKALYGIPDVRITQPDNDLGIFAAGSGAEPSEQDLEEFISLFRPDIQLSTSWVTIQSIRGQRPLRYRDNLETQVDVQTASGLIYPQAITVYTALDGDFDSLFEAMDGSFCELKVRGNDTTECGTLQLTRVLSISYGGSEFNQDDDSLTFNNRFAWNDRVCSEIMKFSLQGHTIVTASGDTGVAGSGCHSRDGRERNIFDTSTPSGCPYSTSVGGTRLYPGQSTGDPESSMAIGKMTSGGGFSNFYPTPAYQQQAVSAYLSAFEDFPSYNSGQNPANVGEGGGLFNRGGRGYPDVSANGCLQPFIDNGQVIAGAGTSLSAPIFASIITLINGERAAVGKGPVGFINPVLYEHPYVLNDITSGSNPGCGTNGFRASQGWDPVTGLGTPNYPKMLELFMSLP